MVLNNISTEENKSFIQKEEDSWIMKASELVNRFKQKLKKNNTLISKKMRMKAYELVNRFKQKLKKNNTFIRKKMRMLTKKDTNNDQLTKKRKTLINNIFKIKMHNFVLIHILRDIREDIIKLLKKSKNARKRQKLMLLYIDINKYYQKYKKVQLDQQKMHSSRLNQLSFDKKDDFFQEQEIYFNKKSMAQEDSFNEKPIQDHLSRLFSLQALQERKSRNLNSLLKKKSFSRKVFNKIGSFFKKLFKFS